MTPPPRVPQDDASDGPLDDDKALLLGALGATAAGAVTVGAVAGALKTAQDRGEPAQKTDQYREEPQKTAQGQKETSTGLLPDQEEISKTSQDQETPSTVHKSSESPSTAQSRIESRSDESPGDGGAATAAAAVIGTGSAVTAAVLTGAALKSDDDTDSAAVTSALSQMENPKTEEERGESANNIGEVKIVDVVTKDGAVEAACTPQLEEKHEDDLPPISSQGHSDVLMSSEVAKSPDENVDVAFSEDRDPTSLQSEPAMSVSPDDSVFDDKPPQLQSESLADHQQSPTEALVADVDGSAAAESEAVSSASGRESLSARLPEPPSTSPRSEGGDDPTRLSSPNVEAPVQMSTEQDDPTVKSPEEEPEKEAVTAEPSVEEFSDRSKMDDEVKETAALLVATDAHHANLEAAEDSRVQSSAGVDDKEDLTTAAGGEHDIRSPTEWESLIQPAEVPSSTPMKESDNQSTNDEDDSHAQSSADQESIQPLAKTESDIPSTITEEASGAVSNLVKAEDHITSLEADKAESASESKDNAHTESIGETDHPSQLEAEDSHIPSPDPTQPDTTTDRSDIASVAKIDHDEKDDGQGESEAVSSAEKELTKDDYTREEVDTPNIVPTKRQAQQPTPEYEKFMSILVSPKGGRQTNVEQAGDEHSAKRTEDTEQDQTPSETDGTAKSEDPSGILQKREEEDESRAESTADAVCGSATDLQEKIDSVQSPVPSVKEEPIVKVDRFSIGSDGGSASEGFPKESGPDGVNVETAYSVDAIQDDKNVEDAQLDSSSSPSGMQTSHDISHKDLGSLDGNTQVGDSKDVSFDAGPTDNVLKRDASPDVVHPKDESDPGLQADLDLGNTGLSAPSAISEAAEESDVAHDISERTEDYEFDPLARTQSFVFPDELAGRSSQPSEKPTSPFPDIDEGGDNRDTSVTPSTSDVRQVEQGEADKMTQEASVVRGEEALSSSEPKITAPETQATTSSKDKVEPERASTVPADGAPSVAVYERDGEQVQPEEKAVTSEAEKSEDKSENEIPGSTLSGHQHEGVNTEDTTSGAQASPSQPAVAEETDDSDKLSKETEQQPAEVEQAATKIQAGVRGWQTRRKISRQQAAATQIQAGFRGWRVRRGRRMRRTSSLPDLSKSAPSASDDQYMDVDILKDRAAAKIQAGFRGWRTRQEMKTLAAASPLEDAPRVSPAISMTEINAEEQAAARIQAGYRGWKTRRKLRRSLSDPNSEALVLAESQRQTRVAETGMGASGPDQTAFDDRLTSSVGAVTPRDEDETAHSIQSIQSEIASSGDTPRKDGGASPATSPTTEPTPAAQSVDEPSKAETSADSSTVEPSGDSSTLSDPSQAGPSSTNPPTAPLLSVDESQLAEAATKIQAGYRGWKTRQQMRDPAMTLRPTVSAKSVTDSGALPIDYAIVHRPEDDWLTQDLMKIEAEKRDAGGEGVPEPRTDEKLVATASDEPDGKGGKDTRPDSASTTESSSSWLTHAQTEIRASFQGLRDNVSDALKTVEDTARLVQEKGAAAGGEDGVEDGTVTVAENVRRVTASGAGPAQSESEDPQGSPRQAGFTLEPLKPDGQTGMDATDAGSSEKSPSEREEMEIWEEIQRSMRHED